MSPLAGVAHGWSFLVARGRRKGYRTVLAPAFLTAAQPPRRGFQLGQRRGPGAWRGPYRRARRRPGRPDDDSFRTELLTAADLNGRSAPEPGLPTDEQGRPLELLYGIEARGPLSGPVADADMRAARSEALRSYRRFLDQEERFDVDASLPVVLHGVTAAQRASRRSLRSTALWRPGRCRTGAGLPGAALSILAVAAAIVLAGWRAWPGPSDVDVRIARATIQPPSGLVDCGTAGSVTVRGTISADGPTRVTYHGEYEGGATPKARLQFAERGSKSVVLDATPAVGSLPQGRFVLVVDSPEPERHAIRYDVRCIGATAG